jgi:hypothetical protein
MNMSRGWPFRFWLISQNFVVMLIYRIQGLFDMCHCVVVWIVANTLKDHGAFIFRVKHSKSRTGLRLLHPENECIAVPRKVGEVPRHTVLHHKICIFSDIVMSASNLCSFILLASCYYIHLPSYNTCCYRCNPQCTISNILVVNVFHDVSLIL